MNPKDRARQDIDRQLGQCGWVVQNKGQMNISAALGVAVREFPMLTGEVDYLLYVSGKAIGVLEAKPKGHPLIGVETQASKYSGALPPSFPPTRVPYRLRTRAPAPSRSSQTCWSLMPGAGRSSPSVAPKSYSGS